MQIIYNVFDPRTDIEGMLTEDGELLAKWNISDAYWSNSYFSELMEKLGIGGNRIN
jgi:hypothetical protein